ncbi:hypothetical protein [Clostridium tagluense]|uniref:hypothetical protein n=1 Tax=Clostridium tagluense TaxID=360422 RepID=UPI001CF5A7ED|nr:hypothetical protein [Clostridium tagluense]MCB2300406.1 hypothetical protein [Clostridium tagluense]
MNNYSSVSNANQGSFNNPRQKTWTIMQLGLYGWSIALSTTSFDEAQGTANNLLRSGVKLDNIMMNELVPMDSIITPSL